MGRPLRKLSKQGESGWICSKRRKTSIRLDHAGAAQEQLRGNMQKFVIAFVIVKPANVVDNCNTRPGKAELPAVMREKRCEP